MSDNDTTICGADATHRYTWPGRDEAFICEAHAAKLVAVARAMGLYVQLIPIEPEKMPCQQKVNR